MDNKVWTIKEVSDFIDEVYDLLKIVYSKYTYEEAVDKLKEIKNKLSVDKIEI